MPRRGAKSWNPCRDGAGAVADDEPDVETLFRQQFRREAREGQYMSGLDLLPIVKARRPDLPVFMISAYGDADTVATALARGADEFFTKPVDFPKLKQDIMAVTADALGGQG